MKPQSVPRSFALLAWFMIGMCLPIASAQTWFPQGPIPRMNHSAVLDALTDRMVIFGGTLATSNHTEPLNNLDDVWVLNDAGEANQSWVLINPGGTRPAARNGHSAVYDPMSDQMIIFGGGLGQSSPCANDTWVLTSANGLGSNPTWMQLSPAGSPPPPRSYFAAAYDIRTATMIIFGGADCSTVAYNDVWVLSNANGVGGTPTWTQLAPAGVAPAIREGSTVVYDAVNNRLIVFGGATASGSLNDLWVLENANGFGGTPAWIELSPSGGPPAARSGHSAVYDQANNCMMIYGGSGAAGILNDVWVLSNANGLGGSPTWTMLGPFGAFAQARTAHTAVYSPYRNEMIVFGGGTAFGTGTDTAVSDVWVLTDANGL